MRLIDADALKKYIDMQKGRPFIGCTIGEALKIMTDEQPTIDIVRCKDCKHWSEKACHKFLATHPSDADDFCSYGEREGE